MGLTAKPWDLAGLFSLYLVFISHVNTFLVSYQKIRVNNLKNTSDVNINFLKAP